MKFEKQENDDKGQAQTRGNADEGQARVNRLAWVNRLTGSGESTIENGLKIHFESFAYFNGSQ